MKDSILDVFFPTTLTPEFYDIPISEKEGLAIAYASQSTAEKVRNMVAKNSDGVPVVRNDCLILSLQKKYSFTNYQTVLKSQSEQPFTSSFGEKLNIVAEWLINKYGNGQLEENGKIVEITDRWLNQVISFPSLRKKYITSEEIHNICVEMFVDPRINEKVYDITSLINTRFHDVSWLHNDTQNLPPSLLEKFNYYIEMENKQWQEEKPISEDTEQLGEFLEIELEAESQPMLTQSEESEEEEESMTTTEKTSKSA